MQGRGMIDADARRYILDAAARLNGLPGDVGEKIYAPVLQWVRKGVNPQFMTIIRQYGLSGDLVVASTGGVVSRLRLTDGVDTDKDGVARTLPVGEFDEVFSISHFG